MDDDRGTGRTTRQMQAAPQGATFIWVNHHLGYPRDLARHLGRTDLVIISPLYIAFRLRGRRNLDIVVDHACEALSTADWAAIRFAERRAA